METKKDQLRTLNDIKAMMERSSRFISLSGLSGVFAGITALIGAYFAQIALAKYATQDANFQNDLAIEISLLKIGLMVLSAAIVGSFIFTFRQSQKKNLPIWDKTAKNVLINLAIPLVAGGFFVFALLFNQVNSYGLIAPTCLVFYGLALINASKYTYSDIRYLGLCEVVLGILAMFFTNYGLYFWAFGFGLLHIIYGAIVYFKYEKANV